MSKYDVNIKRLGLLLLPTFWRKPILATFVYATVTPLSYIYTQFTLFRRESDYRLTHNGQVCYLRAVLNDQFDPIERRITITDKAINAGAMFLYKREIERPQLIPGRETGRARVINRRGSSGTDAFDFWVNLPSNLFYSIDVARLRAIVSAYKLASKRFSINYI